MNCNYADALTHPSETDEVREKRFLCSQSILLTLKGVPGIYFHSLFGSRNDLEGMKATGRNRTINREKLNYTHLIEELNLENSYRNRVFTRYKKMLDMRRTHACFSPLASQEVLDLDQGCFCILKASLQKDERVLCLHNATQKVLDVKVDLGVKRGYELLSQRAIELDVGIRIEPLEYLWIKLD